MSVLLSIGAPEQEEPLLQTFAEKVEAFLAHPGEVLNAALFEAGLEYDRDALPGSLKRTGAFANTDPLPVFTHFVEPHHEGRLPAFVKPKVVFDGPDFMVLLNDKVPYPEAYEAMGQPASTAGMAFVHLLAIPKERIYNAVTLTAKHKPLLRAMQAAALVLAAVDRPRLSKLVCELVEQRAPEFLERALADAEAYVSGPVPPSEFFFHAHGRDAVGNWTGHSVGHLHMHCLSGPRTSFVDSEKNVPFDEVYKQLDSNSFDAAAVLVDMEASRTT